MYVTSILRKPDISYCKACFQLVIASHAFNDSTLNFVCQVSDSGGLLWALVRSAKPAQLFLRVTWEKVSKRNLAVFLKGHSLSLSWEKTLTFGKRVAFLYLLQLVGLDGKRARMWVNNECVREHGSPGAHTDLLEHGVRCDHPCSSPNPPCCVLAPNTRNSFQPQSGTCTLLGMS